MNDFPVPSEINHAKMKMVTVNGVKFRMDQSGKTLQRIDSNTPGKLDNYVFQGQPSSV